MVLPHLLLLCCLLGLSSAWNQPSTCSVRQSSCSGVTEQLGEIHQTLESIQQTLAASFDRLFNVLSQGSVTEPTLPTTSSGTTDPLTTESATTTTETLATPSTLPSEPCGGPGWRRVALINMTDPDQDCPQGLSETGYSIRSCGRTHTGFYGCSSVTFPVGSSQYSQVCGRARAYRQGIAYAFYQYYNGQTIDGYYVDGLSLTHGSPRTHIWTFASGQFNGTNNTGTARFRCPCDPGNPNDPPPFVGNDYFCESVARADNWSGFQFFPDNALWDGEDLLSPCYGLNNPPWFYKTLPVPTSDDIELRMCFFYGENNSNIGIELLDIFVQ